MPLPRNLRFPILNAHAIPITRTWGPSLRPFSQRTSALASSDYGSGTGDPKGENPQSQGSNPSADKEHPGPPPPKPGQGTGGGPTKGTSTGHNTSSSPSAPKKDGGEHASSSPGGGKREFSSSARTRREDELRSKGTKGAEPKILNDAPPPAGEEPEDVKRHNEEMARSYDRAHAKVTEADPEKEKVGKGFWTGHAGDKQSK